MMSEKERLLRSMFPYETFALGRGGDEVNGLPADVVPAGEIVGTFASKREADRRFYLVKVENILFLLRVCEAYPDSGYEKFAVIHASSLTESTDDVTALFERWSESLG